MKKLVGLVMALSMVLSIFSTTAFANDTVKAKVTESSITLNGTQIQIAGFNIKNNNYFKLRDLALAFSKTTSHFDIVWNGNKNAIEILTGKPYTPSSSEIYTYYSSYRDYSAQPTASAIYVDGVLVQITAYNIDGNNYFQLRDLGQLVPFDVTFNSLSDQITLFSQLPDDVYRVETAFTTSFNTVSAHYPRWKSTVTSYLTHNLDHTISAIRAEDQVNIETYNEQYQLVDQKSLAYELPLFGGFYSGEKYNYIAFGQQNTEEDDNKEVIRIVRYDKSYNRIDSVSVKGGESYTTIPFDAAAGRMAENGDTLVFHTSRERYKTEDGLNHQSQLTLIVNTSSMTTTNNLGRFQANHVSHSFDQYVLFDGNTQVLLDHGDAYPRTIVLGKGDGNSYTDVDLFNIPGAIGANMTGVSIGGFEMTSTSYIAALNTVDHSKVTGYTSYDMIGLDIDQRDIILSILPRDSVSNSAVKQITLATYIDTDKLASIPQLVKINDGKLMVLWQEFNKNFETGDLKYVFIDHNGNTIDGVQTREHYLLSNSQPIFVNNQVVWYTDNSTTRMFYSIPL